MSAAAAPANSVRTTRRFRIVCFVAVALAAAWAVWPLGGSTFANTAAGTTPPREPKTIIPRSLDLEAFRTPLWVAPPPPPAPPAPVPPPPPLKLQLIAIVAETADSTERSALFYDPDQDKLLSLRRGDSIGGRKIEQVTNQSVQVRDVSGLRTLSLRNEQPAGSP